MEIASAIITDHAREEMTRRGVTEEMVRHVLENPGQMLDVRVGRVVAQSKLAVKGRDYLLRVFVDTDRSPAEVVTSYITGKVGKYWKEIP